MTDIGRIATTDYLKSREGLIVELEVMRLSCARAIADGETLRARVKELEESLANSVAELAAKPGDKP